MDALSRLVNDPVMTTLAEAILHFVWQGCLLSLALYVVLRSVPRRYSELRYILSLLTLFAMALLPIVTFGYLYTPTVSAASGSVANAVVDTTFHLTTSFGVAPNYLSVISVGWGVGVLFLSLKMLLEIFQVYKLPKQQVLPAGPHLTALFEKLVEQLSLDRHVVLRLSGVADVPMVVGIFKPVVLLPFSMASGLTPAQLEMLLMHELAHIKRHDFLVNLLQTIVEIMLFFHPAVGWVSRQVRIERECCCDDIAVKYCGNRHAYATALTEVEHIRYNTIPHLAMAATGGDLKHRVLRMLNVHDCTQQTPRRWPGVAFAALVSLVGAGFLFSLPFAFEERFKQLAGYEVEPSDPVAIRSDDQLLAETDVESSQFETATNLASTSRIDSEELKADAISLQQNESTPVVAASEVSENEAAVLVAGVQPDTATSDPKTVATADTSAGDEPLVAELETLQPSRTDVAALAPSVTLAVSASKSQSDVSEPTFAESLEVVASADGDVARDITAIETLNGDVLAPGNAFTEAEVPVIAAPIEAQLVSMIKGTRSEQPFPGYTEKVAPSPIEVTAPVYPRAAIMRHAADEIEVSFIVNANGQVEQIRFGDNTRHFFKKAIRKALGEWRFSPGTINGEITAMKVRKVFSFSEPDRKSLRLTGSRLPRRT